MKDRYDRDDDIETKEKNPSDHLVMSSLMTFLYIVGTACWVGANLTLPKPDKIYEGNEWKL